MSPRASADSSGGCTWIPFVCEATSISGVVMSQSLLSGRLYRRLSPLMSHLNCPTLSSNKQHVSVRTDTGYGILRILLPAYAVISPKASPADTLLPSQLVKSTSVGTWAFIHMPDDLGRSEHSSKNKRNSVLGRVDRGQLRHPRAVLPDADGVVVRADDVRLCHVDVLRLDVDVLGIHRRPDGVAEDENVYPNFVCPRCKDTEVAMGSDARQGLDELD
eukprot:761022-Hanusia_phi.AAC.1